MARTQYLSLAMRMVQVPGRSPAQYLDTVWKSPPLWPASSVLAAKFSTSCVVRADAKSPSGGPGTKATEAQLVEIKNRMSESIPRLFTVKHNFDDYHPNVVFEDNIRKVRTTGLFEYYRQVTQARAFCSIRYTASKITLLKITHDTQDSTVCTRWTFKGYNLMSVLRGYLKSRFTGIESAPSRVIDGFSIMYVGDDGRVWKHVIEKMIPDPDSVLRDETTFASPKIQDASLAVDPKS